MYYLGRPLLVSEMAKGIKVIRNFFPELIRRPHRTLLVLLSLWFVTAVSVKVHGFSFSLWHSVIDGSPQRELIAGSSRGIRSDDWLVMLPAIHSQLVAIPSAPQRNPLLGPGEGPLVSAIPAPIPSKSFVTLFRPITWGYFLGSDIGMSWHWFFYTTGLLYSSFLVFMLITRNRFEPSLLMSIALVYAPFFQFWSLNAAPMVISCFGSLLSVNKLLRTNRKLTAGGWALSACYWGTAFVFAIYPPYQITLGYLFLFLSAGLAYGSRAEIAILWRWKVALGTLAAACTAFFAYRYYLEIREPLNLMLNTAYPGQRLSVGGNGSAAKFFNNVLFSYVFPAGRQAFGNICEGASFYFLFPALIIYLVFSREKPWRSDLGVWVALCAFVVCGLSWVFIPFPVSFAKSTLLSMVPEDRSIIALGVANACIVLLFTVANIRFHPKPAALVTFGWLLAMFLIARQLSSLSGIPLSILTTVALFAAFQLGLLLMRPLWGLRLFAVASVMSTIAFNPIAVGGSDFIKNNDLSATITKINSERPGVWVSYGDLILPNLFRMIGVRAINGVHFYPQFEIWRVLDPDGKYIAAYNRYAHVIFEASETDDVIISNPQNDVVLVKISPEHPALEKLGVDYLLINGAPPKGLKNSTRFREIAKIEKAKFIYRRTRDSTKPSDARNM